MNAKMGDAAAQAPRPCCVRVFEGLHLAALPMGLLVSPSGQAMHALPWLALMLMAALAITRLRLALVWLLATAIGIGFLIFIPIGVAFQAARLVDNPMSWLRIAYVLLVASASLFFLWRRDTMVWMREKGGRLSMAVF